MQAKPKILCVDDERDILDLLVFEPEIFQINQSLAGVNWYRNHLEELKTILPSQTNLL